MRAVVRSAPGLLLGILCLASPSRAQDAPYTLTELVRDVRARLGEGRIRDLARQRCLGFTLGPQGVSQLRSAGASEQLVRDLGAVCRKTQTGGAAPAPAAQATLSVDELIARGDRRRRQDDHAGALRDYRQAIARDGSNARAHSLAAEMLSILDRDTEALTAYQRVASLQPTVSEHHGNVAYTLNRLRRYQEAEGHARQAVDLDRNSASAHYQLGWALKGRGELEAARRSLAEAVRIAPGGNAWQWMLDEVEQRLGTVGVSTRHFDIPEIGGYVESVRFFQGASGSVPNDQRVHRYRFSRDSAGFISYELTLRHPAPSQLTRFEVVAVFHRAGGGEWFRDTLASQVLSPNTSGLTSYTRTRGFSTPGQWRTGSYRVDFLHQGERIASSGFEIVDSAAVDIPSVNGRVVSLRFFEAGASPPAPVDRTYRHRFPATARYVYAVADIAFPVLRQPADLNLLCIYYGPDGREVGRSGYLYGSAPLNGMMLTYVNRGWGHAEPGKWSKGRYSVDVMSGSRRIARGWFDVY